MAAGREDTTKQQGLCSFREEVLIFDAVWVCFSTKTNLEHCDAGTLKQVLSQILRFLSSFLGFTVPIFLLYFIFHCRELLITIFSLINQVKLVCIMLFTIHIVL